LKISVNISVLLFLACWARVVGSEVGPKRKW